MSEQTPLSETELDQLCGFIYRRTGMSYGEGKRYFIERRLNDRMRRTESRTVSAYLARLAADEAEAERLVNSITVNETYFYREEHQLRCLGQSILPELVRTRGPGDLVRIWSAPCSTGEESYSIALWLLENWPLVDAYNIEIVGSDIDTAALETARIGRYGTRALNRLPPRVLHAYFEPLDRDTWQIIGDLRESVRFTTANLVDAASVAAQGRFDLIFCRNMLIYFDDDSRARAADLLFDALLPGGFVCLGHTESMSRISTRFAQRRFAEAVVAQRPPENGR